MEGPTQRGAGDRGATPARSRRWPWIVVVALAAVVAWGGGRLALEVARSRAAAFFRDARIGGHSVRARDVGITDGVRGIHLRDVTVEGPPAAAGPGSMRIRIPVLRIVGVDRWSLVRGGILAADSVVARGGSVAHRSGGVGSFSVELGDVIVRRGGGEPAGAVRFEGGRFELTDLTHRSRDSLYATTVARLEGRAGDSVLAVRELVVEPTVSPAEFARRLRHRSDRYEVRAGAVLAEGVDFGSLRRGSVDVRAVTVDSLVVRVTTDKRLPPDPDRPGPVLPHEAARAAPPFDVDTMRVRGGSITYVEWASDGSRPGHLTFDRLRIDARNVTNDPGAMTDSTPAVVDARAHLAGAGLLETTLRLRLLAPELELAYRGRLGSMDPRALNTILAPVEGIRVEAGRIDEIRFDAWVEGGVASGSLRASYRDLDVVGVDKRTDERGLGERLASIVADVRIRSGNRPGSEGAVPSAPVTGRVGSDDTFFGFLWETLRGGILSTIRRF